MRKLKTIVHYSLFTVIFLFISSIAFAQYSGISMQNLSTVKVDDLSDDQVNQFWIQAQTSGMSMDKLEALAKQRKMPIIELDKLKSRIEKLNKAGVVDVNEKSRDEQSKSTNDNDETNVKDVNAAFSSLKPKIFGADLFTNKNLTFEPNLKLATPQNYQLGPDDELIIDVYGNSETTNRLKVSPEGSIRIPLVGPVSVGGLTIEQAKKRIISQLSTIYSGIANGETSVNVTLGNIRSIKVSILGEINMPGSYTLSSLATVFNALYASGGPNENASFRNIKVIRNGKLISTVDVYEFLLKGEAKGNIRLQDQDVIKVSPYETRVEMLGEVKRPGLYETIKGETIKDLISFAGGFSNNAYKERIKVYRNTSKGKSVADISGDAISTFIPQGGDEFIIDKLLDRFSNRVQINGAVFRPGYFAIEDGLTVGKLIEKADGIKEDAFTERAIIYRLKEDNSLQVLSFNITDVMAGKNDIVLKREDNIQIASKLDLKESFNVKINGEVIKPGTFPYGDNMKVEDLIIAAGGLKESSSTKVEISRRIKSSNPNTESSQIINYEITPSLTPTSDIVLLPFDIVNVYPVPGYGPQKNIKIEGEVLFPGSYTLGKKNESITEIIKRAGGLTKEAFPEGAVLIRATKTTEVDQIITQKKLDAIVKQSSDTIKSKSLSDKESQLTPSIVGIDLAKILKKSGSKFDLFLEDNDIIRIPKTLQTVQVSGEVLYPVKMKYQKGKGFKKYINESGGFSARSLRKRSYIVYANGTADATNNFLFFKFYPKVKPGAELIVPVKLENKKLSALEIAGIATSLASLALILTTVLKK